MAIDPKRFERMRSLFDHAMSLRLANRAAFIASNAADDESLRRELLAMVAAADDSSFLASPPDCVPSPPRAVNGPEVGTQIGRYRLLREIGRGGMGVVYLAVRNDDVFHKVVALKLIGAGVTDDFIRRFRQERQILAGMDHPNVARILDGGDTDDGRPFYVMEHVEGTPIDAHCRNASLDVAERVRLFLQVCHAVDYLHEQAIIHRDIKPSNILVTPAGQVKLLDFGIAKVQTVRGLVNELSSPGQPTMILTPNYASPEQLDGQEVTKASDVYSLGVVLYQLLTGRLPRTAADAQSGTFPPPSTIVEAERRSGEASTLTQHRITPDLDCVVLGALHRDPSRRYASVRLLCEELERVLAGRPVLARGDSWTYILSRFVRRNQVAAALAALLLVAAGVAGVSTFRRRLDTAHVEAREAELERIIAVLKEHIDNWPQLAPEVASREKLADVDRVNRIVTSAMVPSLLSAGSSPARVEQLVAGTRQLLDDADALARDDPAVRKSIALTYRRMGDLEASALAPRTASTKNAIESYQRALTITASLEPADHEWASSQLVELSALLERVGGTVDAALVVPKREALRESPAPAAWPAPPPQQGTRPVTSEPPVADVPIADRVAPLEELERQYRRVTMRVEAARRNVASLRERLATQGQQPRPQINESMAQVERFVQEARTGLDHKDAVGAAANLRRAVYVLGRDLREVSR